MKIIRQSKVRDLFESAAWHFRNFTGVTAVILFILISICIFCAQRADAESKMMNTESSGAMYRLQERQTKALEQIAREIGRLERCK